MRTCNLLKLTYRCTRNLDLNLQPIHSSNKYKWETPCGDPPNQPLNNQYWEPPSPQPIRPTSFSTFYLSSRFPTVAQSLFSNPPSFHNTRTQYKHTNIKQHNFLHTKIDTFYPPFSSFYKTICPKILIIFSSFL